MYKKIVLFALAVFGFNCLYGVLNSVEASAYAASLTVPSTTVIDVAAVGNSANVTASNIVVDSTCPLGYTVSIAGPTDNTLYRNGDKTESYSIPASSGTLENPTSILGDNIGTWGYTMESNATINSNFAGVTNTMTDIVTKGSGSASGGDTIPVYFGVSVPNTLIPGDYTLAESSAGAGDNTITYLLTPNANCSTIKLAYNDNGANSTTTMSITHTVNENDVVTLAASNYQKSGYGFAGWSLTALNADAATFQTDLATAKTNGDVFGPNEDITINAHVLSKVTVINNELIIPLYAIWVKAETGVTFQTWTGCNSMSIGDVTALKDARDNDVYAVAKLADENCWMIENMRLDYTATRGATNEALSQGYATSTTYGNFIGLAEPETANFFDSTTANSVYYSGTQSGTASINIGSSFAGYRFPRYNNSNTGSTVSDMAVRNANVYSYGNYYTWAAALANTIYYASSTDIDDNGKTSETVGTSLCPAGWRLPYGGFTGNGATSGGFSYLDIQLGGDGMYADSGTTPTGADMSKVWRSYPNNFVYSGLATNGAVTISSRGNESNYWVSTAKSTEEARLFYLSGTREYPGTASKDKFRGASVRCVASQYTIAFNANGGSGTMNDQTAILDVATTLDSSTLIAPAGKVFGSWNTAADGSGTSYADGASVTNLTTSGSTITLYAQWVCGPGYICYDDNGANSSTKMSAQAVSSSDSEVTLWASNYQRSGYGLAGWNTAEDGLGTNYGPNETINDATVLSTIQSSGLTLYAKWVQSTDSLQSWGGCSLMNEGDVTALTDSRDNNTYAVAKLADGNCWMIENLRLADVDSDNNPITLSSANTNNPSLPLNNADGTTSNSLSPSSDPTAASTSWCAGGSSSCIDKSILFAGNSDETVDNMTSVDSNIYSYGNYYNWYSATAGYGKYGMSSVTDGDLCPTGWHLPYGGIGTGTKGGQTSGGFSYLDIELNGTGVDQSGTTASLRWRAYPNNFIYSGGITASSTMFVQGRGSYGIYWTSTGVDRTRASVMMLDNTTLRPGTYFDYKTSGYMARCVLNN